MKKILLIAGLIMSLNISAQTDSSKHVDCYIAGFLSTTSGNNFNSNTYAGLELGVYLKESLALGVVTGRGNLDFSSDMKEYYWSEVKGTAYKQFGSVTCYVLAGWGQYYNTTHSFIEYGGGAIYSIKKFDIGVTVSNWDNIFYVSPGITYNFRIGK